MPSRRHSEEAGALPSPPASSALTIARLRGAPIIGRRPQHPVNERPPCPKLHPKIARYAPAPA